MAAVAGDMAAVVAVSVVAGAEAFAAGTVVEAAFAAGTVVEAASAVDTVEAATVVEDMGMVAEDMGMVAEDMGMVAGDTDAAGVVGGMGSVSG
jgi:hypothetical protein